MKDHGIRDKVALVTGGNNPLGIGAAVARALAECGAHVFIHYYRQDAGSLGADHSDGARSDQTPGLPLFFEQQKKTADEVIASIRKAGSRVESFECDLREPGSADRLFDEAIKAFGQIDILVNNAAEYAADTFLPSSVPGVGEEVWEGGPIFSTIDEKSHDRHFAVNSRAPAILTARFAKHIIERNANWGRIINISADCAWGCPKEISYRASKYALESYSRSAAAELGPYGITVNVVSPGPVQSGYISPEMEEALVSDIPMRRIGHPEDIANAVLLFSSENAGWITGQVLFVHGGHRMELGIK
jgi:3-oxoacyl-[acyl-carrier protein] reductase